MTPAPRAMKVILHNSVSLNGALAGFDADLGEHYRWVKAYKPDIILVGSVTAKAAETEAPSEEESDFKKTGRTKGFIWAFVDSGGVLRGLLHFYRRFELCRDIVVLAARKTPRSYLDYLKKRDYDFIIAGERKVDLPKALRMLAGRYKARTILADTGAVSGSLLLRSNLVDELSLVVHPIFVASPVNLFAHLRLDNNLDLELLRCHSAGGGLVHLVYKVKKRAKGKK